MRGLDCIAHWKGTELRTFLHYLGIVVLKDHLTTEAYQHFLLLFCAVTICTSKRYFNTLPTARAMLLLFIEMFGEIYGEHCITSNVHNLCHLVDDVAAAVAHWCKLQREYWKTSIVTWIPESRWIRLQRHIEMKRLWVNEIMVTTFQIVWNCWLEKIAHFTPKSNWRNIVLAPMQLIDCF